MATVENINKLAKYLKINAGQVATGEDNIPTRTTKSGSIRGYSSILHSFARELPPPVADDEELPFLIAQWFDYSALFVDPATKDKAYASALLKELDAYLLTRSYLVGQTISIADLAVFLTISPVVVDLSTSAKEQLYQVCRWFDHVQNVTNFRQAEKRQFVNFLALSLASSHH